MTDFCDVNENSLDLLEATVQWPAMYLEIFQFHRKMHPLASYFILAICYIIPHTAQIYIAINMHILEMTADGENQVEIAVNMVISQSGDLTLIRIIGRQRQRSDLVISKFCDHNHCRLACTMQQNPRRSLHGLIQIAGFGLHCKIQV